MKCLLQGHTARMGKPRFEARSSSPSCCLVFESKPKNGQPFPSPSSRGQNKLIFCDSLPMTHFLPSPTPHSLYPGPPTHSFLNGNQEQTAHHCLVPELQREARGEAGVGALDGSPWQTPLLQPCRLAPARSGETAFLGLKATPPQVLATSISGLH